MRVYRNMSEEQKRKISEALKGRKKPADVRKRISASLRKHWSSIPWKEGGE